MGPIVLVHGAGGASWRDFAPLIPYLERSREVEILRVPGHYEAEPLEEGADLSIEAFTDRLVEQLDRLGLDAPDVVGDSTGGWLALELARRGRARAVVGISPSGMWTPEEGRRVERDLKRTFALARYTLPLLTSLTRTAAGRYLVFSPVLGTRGAALAPEEASHVVRALARSQVGLGPVSANKDENGDLKRASRMDEVTCPVLIIWGEQDRLLPRVQGERWKDAIAGAELEELEGTGHHPQYDKPEEVAELVIDFFAR
ncbi:MAG: alpha/beta hydrolase [Thermoleophilaceae bacterium]|nr:alpha/beta hydrolase [Thermoleophilaceae bacterium]